MNIVDLSKKILEDEIVKNIINFSGDTEIWLVGGTIRDFMLGKENFDKDIVVNCDDVKSFSLKLAEKFDATFVPLDEVNKIYRLVLKDKKNSIDIAKIIGDSFIDDIKRRDFTINSIAFDLKNKKIIDVNNGLDDLSHKVIKEISLKNLEDDPLRLLRALRFKACLGFELSKNLTTFIDENYKMLEDVSIERINAELVKLFKGKYTAETLKDAGNIIDFLFPVMTDVKKVPENSHHHLPLFYHSIETVAQVQKLYEKAREEVREHLQENDFTRLSMLKLSAFLHDIGKPQTWTIEGDRHRFIKHDDVGSKLCIPLLKKLNFSKKQIQYISLMIKNHIYPSQVVSSPEVNEKVYMRFVRKAGDNAIDMILLAAADRLSARGYAITDEIVNSNINGLNHLLEFYLNARKTLKPLPVLLDGNEIMKRFNLTPSPLLGKLISELKEAQINGEVETVDEAINYIGSRLQDI